MLIRNIRFRRWIHRSPRSCSSLKISKFVQARLPSSQRAFDFTKAGFSTSIQNTWERYTDGYENSRLWPASDLISLQKDAETWVAVSASDIEIIAKACIVLTKLTGPLRMNALSCLIKNLESGWCGRQPLSKEQVQLCLIALGGYMDHDENADRLLGLVNKELVPCLEGTVILSIEEIATALEQITRFNRSTESLRHFLMIMAKQLSFSRPDPATPNEVYRLLIALRSKYEGLLVDGRKKFRTAETTNLILPHLPLLIDNATDVFPISNLVEILAQLKGLGNHTDAEIRIMESIERQMSKSYEIFGPGSCSGKAVSAAIYGLRLQTADNLSVRRVVSLLAKIMADTHEGYSFNMLLLSMNGLRCMSSDKSEVRALINEISNRIAAHTTGPPPRVSWEYVRLAIGGLQNMRSDNEEVKRLITAITPVVLSSLNRGSFAQCLFYMRNIRQKDAHFIFELLLHYFSELEQAPKSFIKEHWDETVASYMMQVSRYLRMGEAEITKALNTNRQQEFQKMLKKLESTLPMVEKHDKGFMSMTEYDFFNLLKNEFYKKKDIQVQGNVFLFGFEADLLMTMIDESSGHVHMIINIELDVGDAHTQAFKRMHDHCRDRYLSKEHGIFVLRLSREMTMRARAKSATVASLLLEAAEQAYDEETVARMRIYFTKC